MRSDLDAADFDREAIDAAKTRAPSEKLRDGLRLFDRTSRIMADGIRHEHPGATLREVRLMLRERLRLARSLEREQQ